MLSIKVKASTVRRSAQTLLDHYEVLPNTVRSVLVDPAILSRMKLIVEMMDEVDPDDLVLLDEEAYAFLTQQ